MRTTARVAVLTAFRQPLDILEVELVPPEPGGLLVEMEVATVCGTDVHNWWGDSARVVPPVTPGHEGVGRIVEFGEGARVDSVGTPLAVGDRVVWGHACCGSCYACTVLQDETLCTNRFIGMLTSFSRPPHLHGTFGEYAYIHPHAGRIRVPDGVDSEIASASSCALRSVISTYNRLGALDDRHTVLIQGAGPLGLFATAVAATRGVKSVIVVGAPDERLELAHELGAAATISIERTPDPDDRITQVRDLTEGRGADAVLEFAGTAGAFAEGVAMAAPKGRYVMAGAVAVEPRPFAASAVIHKNLTIVGSLGSTIGDYAHALSFIERNASQFPWHKLVGPGRYTLEQATEALRNTHELKETKAVILPQG